MVSIKNMKNETLCNLPKINCAKPDPIIILWWCYNSFYYSSIYKLIRYLFNNISINDTAHNKKKLNWINIEIGYLIATIPSLLQYIWVTLQIFEIQILFDHDKVNKRFNWLFIWWITFELKYPCVCFHKSIF